MQHTATQCNTLQHNATHCNTMQHTATHCNTLQHNATHCNTMQHTAAFCNPMRHITLKNMSITQLKKSSPIFIATQRWTGCTNSSKQISSYGWVMPHTLCTHVYSIQPRTRLECVCVSLCVCMYALSPLQFTTWIMSRLWKCRLLYLTRVCVYAWVCAHSFYYRLLNASSIHMSNTLVLGYSGKLGSRTHQSTIPLDQVT